MKPAKAKPKAKRKVDHLDGIPVYCRYDEAVDIDRITGHPRNPNKHGDEQIALLAKIIKASGWRNPICVSNRSGFVIKGHARLMAARVLGVTHVPVEYQDYATEAEEYNDMIADNRIAELAERDMSIIKDLLEELDTGANDMDLTGYDEAEIERLMTETPKDGLTIKQLELYPYEHYDYVIVMADKVQDWEWLAEFCELEKVDGRNPKSGAKIGLCRAIKASKLIEKIQGLINEN